MLCEDLGNMQTLTFSHKSDAVLQFVSSELWETSGFPPPGGKMNRLCEAQPKSELLIAEDVIGYCDKTKDGNITFSTLSQLPTNGGYAYLPEQLIFFPLEPGKFEGLTVYKTLPVSEECRKDFADILDSDEAKLCIQESMQLFAAEAENTQEGKEFREFLKGLAQAR